MNILSGLPRGFAGPNRIKILPITKKVNPNDGDKETKANKPLELPLITKFKETQKTPNDPVKKSSFESLPYIDFSRFSKQDSMSSRANRVDTINCLIKTCEKAKSCKDLKSLAGFYTNRREVQNVLDVMDKKFRRKQSSKPNKKKDNEFYLTRVQMKKMIQELRTFTKHIGL
jgi:poly-D-alanine transfer protein DltD